MWQPRLRAGARTKYLGIVEALEEDIRAGRTQPGARLPAQRAIAEALDLDLTTVTRAFNEARRRGLVEAQAGRGTFVRVGVVAALRGGAEVPRPAFDLSMNTPPQPEGMDFRRLLPQGIAAVLAGGRGLQYQDSAGAPLDREIAAHWLSRQHGEIGAERVIVTAGAQAALHALCDLLMRPGDRLAAGAMTYPGLKAAALQRGLQVDPVAMDAEGLIPEDFERICAQGAPKALYVVPTIDNPTTATLPAARRQRIAALARRHGVMIIEDDPYGVLRSARPPAFVTLAPTHTWYLSTLSKCVTPALRIAHVIAPDGEQAEALAAVLRSTVLMAAPLMAALASRWIGDGTVEEVTRAIRAENRRRQTLAADILDGHQMASDPEGHHLWLRLPRPWLAGDFASRAELAGLSVVPSSAFAVAEGAADSVRVSLGVSPDRDRLEEALIRFSDLLRMPPRALRAVV